MNLDAATAAQVIEQWRYGLPPRGHSRAFTVGRRPELATLQDRLCHGQDGALLLQAGYGAGKSHLLQVIREMALAAGYAVSLVVANAQEGVRFDRPEALFGAVCRQIEVDDSGHRGIATLFAALARPNPAPRSLSERGDGADDFVGDSGLSRQRTGKDASDRPRRSPRVPPERALLSLSSNGRWDYSEYLQSPALYVALRAWLFGDGETRLLVEDWLTNPAAYRDRRRRLYEELVYRMRDRFRDPRPEWKFHSQELLVLHRAGHSQVWPALADLARLACAAGRRGLVLLFDEVEDVIHNLPRASQRQEGVDNLVRFFAGNLTVARPPGGGYRSAVRADRGTSPRASPRGSGSGADGPFLPAFFAVTPDFIAQVRPYLPALAAAGGEPLRLPAIAVEPVRRDELRELAARIRHTHGLAFHWEAAAALPDAELAALVDRSWQADLPGGLRRSIQEVVQALDARLAGRT